MVRISVLLPVYNGLPYLKDSVEGILQQDFLDYDIHILDDCSTDGSWDYLNTIKSDRIILSRNSRNMGLFFNLNKLVKQSSSSLIKLWSQDDIMQSNTLGSIARFHDIYPSIGFSYTGVKYIDEHNVIIDQGKEDDTPEIIDSEMHARIAFRWGSVAGNIANVTISRFVFDKVGLFNEKMRIAGDTEMWFRIAEHFPIGFMKGKLIYLRRHKGQLSSQEKYYLDHLYEELSAYDYLKGYLSPELIQSGLEDMRKYKLQFYVTLMFKFFAKRRFNTAFRFWRRLAAFDRMDILLKYFFLKKVLKLK